MPRPIVFISYSAPTGSAEFAFLEALCSALELAQIDVFLDRTRLQMAACECCGAIAQNRRAFSFGPAAEGVERGTPACATC